MKVIASSCGTLYCSDFCAHSIVIICSYCLRAVIAKKITDISKEATLWCPVSQAIEVGNEQLLQQYDHGEAVDMDVGLEEFLHIKLHIDQSR